MTSLYLKLSYAAVAIAAAFCLIFMLLGWGIIPPYALAAWVITSIHALAVSAIARRSSAMSPWLRFIAIGVTVQFLGPVLVFHREWFAAIRSESARYRESREERRASEASRRRQADLRDGLEKWLESPALDAIADHRFADCELEAVTALPQGEHLVRFRCELKKDVGDTLHLEGSPRALVHLDASGHLVKGSKYMRRMLSIPAGDLSERVDVNTVLLSGERVWFFDEASFKSFDFDSAGVLKAVAQAELEDGSSRSEYSPVPIGESVFQLDHKAKHGQLALREYAMSGKLKSQFDLIPTRGVRVESVTNFERVGNSEPPSFRVTFEGDDSVIRTVFFDLHGKAIGTGVAEARYDYEKYPNAVELGVKASILIPQTISLANPIHVLEKSGDNRNFGAALTKTLLESFELNQLESPSLADGLNADGSISLAVLHEGRLRLLRITGAGTATLDASFQFSGQYPGQVDGRR